MREGVTGGPRLSAWTGVMLWGEEEGRLEGEPDRPAHCPYRLMERFLMDGLYPSRFAVFLVPVALPPSRQLNLTVHPFAAVVQGGGIGE